MRNNGNNIKNAVSLAACVVARETKEGFEDLGELLATVFGCPKPSYSNHTDLFEVYVTRKKGQAADTLTAIGEKIIRAGEGIRTADITHEGGFIKGAEMLGKNLFGSDEITLVRDIISSEMEG